MLGQRSEKEALNHRNVVYPGHAQHELRRKNRGAANRIGSFGLKWDWQQCRSAVGWSHFLLWHCSVCGEWQSQESAAGFWERASIYICKWTGKNTLSKSQRREQRITAPRESRIEEWTHHQDTEFRDKALEEESVDSACSACEESLAFLTVLGSESTVHGSHVTSRGCWHLTVIPVLGGRGGRKESWGQPGIGRNTESNARLDGSILPTWEESRIQAECFGNIY